MAGQLHIKWISESLAASPAGGAFLYLKMSIFMPITLIIKEA